MANAQWVKPLNPGDIPAGTNAEWNTTTESWEFIPIPSTPPQAPPSNPTAKL